MELSERDWDETVEGQGLWTELQQKAWPSDDEDLLTPVLLAVPQVAQLLPPQPPPQAPPVQ